MNEIHFTYAGLMALTIILLTSIHYRFNIYKIFTDPLVIICFVFYNFFGSYRTINFSFSNDLILLLSFAIFLSAFWLGKKAHLTWLDKKLIDFPKRKHVNGSILTHRAVIWGFFLACILYCIIDLWVNSLIYGGIEKALLRFYSIQVEDISYTTFKNYLSVYFKGMLALVFVFRYFLDLNQRRSWIFFIGVMLLVLIAIPRGSRGAVVSPIVMLVLADIFAKRYHNVNIRRYLSQYVYLGILGISTFLLLTAVRSIKFQSFEDLIEVVNVSTIDKGSEMYSELEGELMLTDTKMCFDRFGNDVEFLPVGYTATSILVSFVPRSLWETKPVSFGLAINALKQGNANIIKYPHKLYYVGAVDWAAGVAGEGWANGGFVGLILYSVIFGVISGKSARLYSILIKPYNYISVIMGLCFYQMSFCFIRGGLQSTFTPALYALIFLLIIIKIIYRK